jgi:hypothetical protein
VFTKRRNRGKQELRSHVIWVSTETKTIRKLQIFYLDIKWEEARIAETKRRKHEIKISC